MAIQLPLRAAADDSRPIYVIGDIMLDTDLIGEVKRQSPEDPTVPVVKLTGSFDYPGGAANVAQNLAKLGQRVWLAGNYAYDSAHLRLMAVCDFKIKLLVSATLATLTTHKVRVHGDKQIVRYDREVSGAPPFADTWSPALLANSAALVLSDYAKGVLTDAAYVRRLLVAAKTYDVPVLAAPKGPWTAYAGIRLLVVNESEARAATNSNGSDVELWQQVHAMRKLLNVANLVVTRGPEPMMLFDAGGWHPVASVETQVKSVAGAGDLVLAVCTYGLLQGWSLDTCCEVATRAATLAVAKPGTCCVDLAELNAALQAAQHTKGISTETKAELAKCLPAWRRAGETIVFTNGCFDVLHAGHVMCLRAASRLADDCKLIVGINSDASVRRLKGAGRPLNPCAARAYVLQNLQVVDLVVSFEEDTPEQLIQVVRPDILVKGGDYQGRPIVGEDFVQSYGGKVVRTSFNPGFSTSDLVHKLKETP